MESVVATACGLDDFVCFFLRRYVELSMELAQPRYANEKEKVDEWVMLILKRAIPKSNIFLNKGRCECSDLFFQCAIDIEKYF